MKDYHRSCRQKVCSCEKKNQVWTVFEPLTSATPLSTALYQLS